MGWNETIQGMLAKEPPMTDLTSLDLETTAESRLGVFAECSLADAILRDFDKLVDFIDRLRDDKQPMADNSGEITAAEDVLTWLLIEKLTCSDDRSYTPHEAQKIVATALDERDTLKARVAELEAGLHSPDHARNRIRPSPPLRKAPDMSEARGADPDPVPAYYPAVIEYPEAGRVEFVLRDGFNVYDKGDDYDIIYDGDTREVIGFAWPLGTNPATKPVRARNPVSAPVPDLGKVKEALRAAIICLRNRDQNEMEMAARAACEAALATLEQTDG